MVSISSKIFVHFSRSIEPTVFGLGDCKSRFSDFFKRTDVSALYSNHSNYLLDKICCRNQFPFIFIHFRNTVLSPINGHSKKRTPLISGRIYFPRRNSGQTLIKNFLKSGQAISGPSV